MYTEETSVLGRRTALPLTLSPGEGWGKFEVPWEVSPGVTWWFPGELKKYKRFFMFQRSFIAQVSNPNFDKREGVPDPSGLGRP